MTVERKEPHPSPFRSVSCKGLTGPSCVKVYFLFSWNVYIL